MKLRYLLIMLLAFCLTGCTLDDTVPGTTAPSSETTLPTTTTESQQAATTEPAETSATEVTPRPEPSDESFVNVKTYIPDIVIDLRYATDNNFTHVPIYDFTDAWLRYGTVKKLISVQEELQSRGLCLKLWDGFRPTSAQFKLWEIYPDSTYVANPNRGFSAHSRGNTVDVTIVYADGTELVMPTGFDDFSELADRDYSDCTEEAAINAQFLEQLMTKHGFKPYAGEWWHFTDTQAYPLEQAFTPIAPSLYYAHCKSYISLRSNPSTAATVLVKIPADQQFWVVASCGEFVYIEYQGLYGYVLRSYTRPVSQVRSSASMVWIPASRSALASTPEPSISVPVKLPS